MAYSLVRVLFLSLHIALGPVSGDLRTLCDNLTVHSFYEQGKCYTLHFVATAAKYSEVYDQCSDIHDDVRNVGLVMWLPDTVKPWLLAVPGMKLAMMGMRSTLRASVLVTYTEVGDSFKFTQSRTFDEGPSWPANYGTHEVLFQPSSLSTGSLRVSEDNCLTYGDYGAGPFLGWFPCEGGHADLKAIICTYATNTHTALKIARHGRRMLATYSVSNETVVNDIACASKMYSDCAPCHSFAFNAATGDCQLYIADSRVIGYNDTMLEVASGYNIWEYK